ALQTNAGWDATTVALTCVAERLPAALALVAEVVRSSAFPEAEVDRMRAQQKARLQQRRMDPASLANEWAARLFYQEGSPYARPLTGTDASLGRLDTGAVQAFAGRSYRPGRGGLVLAGDV